MTEDGTKTFTTNTLQETRTMPSKNYNGNNPLGRKRIKSNGLDTNGALARVETEIGRLQPALSLQTGSLQLPNGRVQIPKRARRGGGGGGVVCKNLQVTKSRPASVYQEPPQTTPKNTTYIWINVGTVDNVLPTNIFTDLLSFDPTSLSTYYVYLECSLAATEFKAETNEIKISTTAPPKTSGSVGGADIRPAKYNFILAYILPGGAIQNTGCGDISTELYATTTTTGTTITVAARRLS